MVLFFLSTGGLTAIFIWMQYHRQRKQRNRHKTLVSQTWCNKSQLVAQHRQENELQPRQELRWLSSFPHNQRAYLHVNLIHLRSFHSRFRRRGSKSWYVFWKIKNPARRQEFKRDDVRKERTSVHWLRARHLRLIWIYNYFSIQGGRSYQIASFLDPSAGRDIHIYIYIHKITIQNILGIRTLTSRLSQMMSLDKRASFHTIDVSQKVIPRIFW